MSGFMPEALRGFAAGLLEALGVPADGAALTADCLVCADLEGQASHGLSRLPLLAQRLRTGLINPRPRLRVVREGPATALLDADNALGPVAGARGMELAVARCQDAGVGVCAVLHGNHLGAVAWYAERAAARGLVGLAFSNTPPALAPPGGRQPYLGTNPIAAALPTTGAPVVIDMATSQVARGRLLLAAQAGRAIPEGWARDAEGRPTTDPGAGIRGALEPVGGDKGFALALLVEALTGVLAGAGVGPDVGGTYLDSDRPSNVGQSFWALDPEVFQPGFGERMEQLAKALRELEPSDPARPVRLPGDRRWRERAQRERIGVELPEALVGELNALAAAAAASGLGVSREAE